MSNLSSSASNQEQGVTSATNISSTSSVNSDDNHTVLLSGGGSSRLMIEVVDDSGNILYDSELSSISHRNHLLQQESLSQQEPGRASNSRLSSRFDHSSSSQMSSSEVFDPQSIGLLNLQGAVEALASCNNDSSSDRNDEIDTGKQESGPPTCSGLIQTVNSVAQEMTTSTISSVESRPLSSSRSLGKFGKTSTVGRLQSSDSIEDFGLIHFNSSHAPDFDISAGMVNLESDTSLSEDNRIQQHFVNQGNNDLSNGTRRSIFPHRPTINLHHGRRSLIQVSSNNVETRNGVTRATSSSLYPTRGLQSSGTTVTQSAQQPPYLVSGSSLVMGSASHSAVPSMPSSMVIGHQQQGVVNVAEPSNGFLTLVHHHPDHSMNEHNASGNTEILQDLQSQLSGIFYAGQTHQDNNLQPGSLSGDLHNNHVGRNIRNNSEAVPIQPHEYPRFNDSEVSQQLHSSTSHEQHQVVSASLDSSSAQQMQYTLVFDAGTQVIRLERVSSTSNSNGVTAPSQIVHNIDGSEAQSAPSVSLASRDYSGQLPTESCGSSDETVGSNTTILQSSSCVNQPKNRIIRRPKINKRPKINLMATESGIQVRSALKIKIGACDESPECDTTQGDVDNFDGDSYTDNTVQLESAASSDPLVKDEDNSQEIDVDDLDTNTGGTIQLADPTGGSEAIPQRSSAGPDHLVRQSVRKSRRLELVAQEVKAGTKKQNYTSQPYDHAQLWCDDCMEPFDNQCPVHRLTAIPDKIVLSRAWASCPNQLQICRLPEHQLTDGDSATCVLAKRQIPKLTQFGPFVGELVNSMDKVTRKYFTLMIDAANNSRQYFETSDENRCNWMMFVRPAKTFAEQNLVAYQHKKGVFFSSTKVIEPRQELKVWYAAHYAEQMGSKPLELTPQDVQALDEADGKFACNECPRRFKSWAALQHHLTSHEEVDMSEQHNDASPHTDGDIDFLLPEGERRDNVSATETRPRYYGGRRGRGRARRKGTSTRGRKKGSFLSMTLRKYKRGHSQRIDKSSPVKGMYRPRGKLHGGKEWMCTHCDLTFDNSSLLNLHTLTHAADVGMEEICKLAPPKMEQATAEFANDIKNVIIENDDDQTEICTAASSDHRLQPDDRALLLVECPQCNSTFDKYTEFMEHVSSHGHKPASQEDVNQCNQCEQSFSSTDELIDHVLTHDGDSDKQLECTVCAKRMSNRTAMINHLKKHSTKKFYSCPICDLGFSTASLLREHAQLTHMGDDGRYRCNTCSDKTFDEFCMLKRHVRCFHSEKSFGCSECNKMFPTLDKLRLHMLRHTSFREFMCETCGKRFKRKDKLMEHHRNVHLKDKPNRNTTSTSMNGVPVQYTVTANSLMPIKRFKPRVQPSEYHRFIYKCHTCMLGFKRRGMLVNHLAKRHPDIRVEHVPELNLPILRTQRDFYCQYCDKIYKSSSKRKSHILKVHPGCAIPPSIRRKGASRENEDHERDPAGPVILNVFSQTVSSTTMMPFGCKFCHKQYASRAKLLQHQRKQHPDVAEPALYIRRKRNTDKPESGVYPLETAGDERIESVLPIAVVSQAAEQNNNITVVTTAAAAATTQHTDLLHLAMSELGYGTAAGINGGMTNLSSLLSSLNTTISAATAPGMTSLSNAGAAMVLPLQTSNIQVQPTNHMDLNQLNSQVSQTFTTGVASNPGHPTSAAGSTLAAILQSPLSPPPPQIHPNPQQQVTVVTPMGPQTFNVAAGGQLIRSWPTNIAPAPPPLTQFR